MIDPPCVDLKKRFPAYPIRYEDDGMKGDPWAAELVFRWGYVYPFGHGELCVYTADPWARRRLFRMAGLRPWQIGDEETVFRFDIGLAGKIFDVLLRRPGPRPLRMPRVPLETPQLARGLEALNADTGQIGRGTVGEPGASG